jgi:ubiquitin-protein ligase
MPVENSKIDGGSDAAGTARTADAAEVEPLRPEVIRRIALDIRSVVKSPPDQTYLITDPYSIGTVYVMIIGPHDTPYHCVPLFFRFEFPSNYPFAPPKATFLTQLPGNNIRLHPNYYKNGKCCLSILNTWRGENWTGCQTLSSVLTTMMMTLTEYPLENEPGLNGRSHQGLLYRSIVLDAGLSIIDSFLTSAYQSCDSSDHKGSQRPQPSEAGSKYQFRVRFCEDDDTNIDILREFQDKYLKFLRSNVSPDLERLGHKTRTELLLDEVTDERHRVYQELFGHFKPKQVISEGVFYPFIYSMRFAETFPSLRCRLSQIKGSGEMEIAKC